jgi:ATP-binding cassette subfamily F protein 3
VESDPGFANSGGRQAQKRAQAEARQARHARRRPYAELLVRLDREIERVSREKAAADAWLASAEAYADANRDHLKATLASQGDLGAQLARLEAEWLTVAEKIERIDAGEP